MAKKNVAKGRAGDKPVSKEIRRAAARMGIAPRAELDRTDEELDHLRAIVSAAEKSFYHQGPVTADPTNVLVEALGATADDIATLGAAEEAGGGVTPGAFRRAQLRCELALSIFEYRQSFGFAEPAGEEEVAS